MALAIDASTPAAATQTNGATATVVSPSFTPPAGSLLLVLWSGNTTNAIAPAAPSITDSLGTPLTYTQTDWESFGDSSINGQAAGWWAVVGTSAAMTVTVTSGTVLSVRHAAIQVIVLTGQKLSGPIGVHGKATSFSATSIAQAYTAQGTNGQGFIGVCDWDATGTETAGTGCTSIAAGTIPTTQISYSFMRRTAADDVNGNSNTLNVTIPSLSANLSWVYVEVLEEPGAAGTIGSTYNLGIPSHLLLQLIIAHNSMYAATQSTTPDQTVPVFGIPSSEALGQPTITTTVTVPVLGITSSERLGNPAVTSTTTVPVLGIPSSEAVGNPSITVITAINAQGIPSSERVGQPSITTTVTVQAHGISSSEAIGNPNTVTATSVTPQGIPSSERLGSPTITTLTTIQAQGITSSEQFGNANAGTVTTVQVFGIPSSEAVGQPSITVLTAINPQGISSSERLGNPTISSTVTLQAHGITSSEQLGSPTFTLATSITPQGIPSSERLGNPTITTGSVTVQAHGIPSSERLGTPQVSLGALSLQVQAHGIPSQQALGQPFIGYQVKVDLIWYSQQPVEYVDTPTTIYWYDKPAIESIVGPEILVVRLPDTAI